MRRSILEGIQRELFKMNLRLFELEKSVNRLSSPESMLMDNDVLLSLPDHLRRSYQTVLSCGKASASEITIKTGRCRALESNYLNQLVREGYLTRRRDGKMVVFYASLAHP